MYQYDIWQMSLYVGDGLVCRFGRNIYGKELCVKLVIYKSYTEMHGQKNKVFTIFLNLLYTTTRHIILKIEWSYYSCFSDLWFMFCICTGLYFILFCMMALQLPLT